MHRLNILIQPLFVIGFLAIVILLFFVEVPEKNSEFFKTALTAIISFISGAALATGAFSNAPGQAGAPQPPTEEEPK